METDFPSRPEVSAPLEAAEAALEAAGYELLEPRLEHCVGFLIPHQFDGECTAVVEFLEGSSLLQITASLSRGFVPVGLRLGLLELLNELNLMMPGSSFTYDQDDEEGDEIEISVTCLVFDEMQLELHVPILVIYLQESLKLSLPAIYAYTSQRVRVRAYSDGSLEFLPPKYTVADVLAMIEFDQYGRA